MPGKGKKGIGAYTGKGIADTAAYGKSQQKQINIQKYKTQKHFKGKKRQKALEGMVPRTSPELSPAIQGVISNYLGTPETRRGVFLPGQVHELQPTPGYTPGRTTPRGGPPQGASRFFSGLEFRAPTGGNNRNLGGGPGRYRMPQDMLSDVPTYTAEGFAGIERQRTLGDIWPEKFAHQAAAERTQRITALAPYRGSLPPVTDTGRGRRTLGLTALAIHQGMTDYSQMPNKLPWSIARRMGISREQWSLLYDNNGNLRPLPDVSYEGGGGVGGPGSVGHGGRGGTGGSGGAKMGWRYPLITWRYL